MSNFQEQVSASEVLARRYGPISDYVVNAIYEKYGVHVPKTAVAKMNCVQVSTYANSDDYISGWTDEAVLLDEVRIARERERLSAALESGGDSVEARQVAQRLAEMDPASRLAFARENGLTGAAKAQNAAKGEGQTVEERAELVRQAESMHGGAKIAFARRHGLI